jgi:hypothetical protein
MSKLCALDAAIVECEKELRCLGSSYGRDGSGSIVRRDLIISTGDISDVDGFFALAKYAQSGADVLFVMNFPAYLKHTENYKECGPGLGYRYNACDFIFGSDKGISTRIDKAIDDGDSLETANLRRRLSQYNALWETDPLSYSDARLTSERLKLVMANLGLCMTSKVWNEAEMPGRSRKGSLYFCIGGVNEINPFHPDTVKNEIFLYLDSLGGAVPMHMSTIDEGSVFSSGGVLLEGGVNAVYGNAVRVFIDFNGSMAFLNDNWMDTFLTRPDKIKGVFVMGGVYSDQEPKTQASILNNINRFSCATMNQLYHPLRTSLFFMCMSLIKVQIFVVANNDVESIVGAGKSFDGSSTDWLRDFLTKNGIYSVSLYTMAKAYYSTGGHAKAFDLYTALVLLQKKDSAMRCVKDAIMYISPIYGVTMLGDGGSWAKVRDKYYSQIDTSGNQADIPFLKYRKMKIKEETEVLSKVQCYPFSVRTVAFDVTSRIISVKSE